MITAGPHCSFERLECEVYLAFCLSLRPRVRVVVYYTKFVTIPSMAYKVDHTALNLD